VEYQCNKLDQYQILKYPLTTESAMKKIEDNNTWNKLDQYQILKYPLTTESAMKKIEVE
jgi:hypothetical protein